MYSSIYWANMTGYLPHQTSKDGRIRVRNFCHLILSDATHLPNRISPPSGIRFSEELTITPSCQIFQRPRLPYRIVSWPT